MLVVFGILSSMLFLITYILLRRTEKRLLLTLDNLVLFVLSIVFGVVFPITYFYSLNHQGNTYLKIVSDYTVLDILKYYICIYLLTLFFSLAFRGAVRDKGVLIKNEEECDIINSSRFYYAAIILFLVGVVSDFLYCRAYGGYIGYLEYSTFIRAGVTDVVYNRWSFLFAFRDCIVISSYLFLAQIKKDGKILVYRALLFAISLILSCMVLYANKGRLSFLIYFSVFILTYMLKKQKDSYFKLRITNLLKFYALGLSGVLGFGYLSNLMGRSDNSRLLDLLFNEVAFVFSNFKVLVDNIKIGDARLFSDIMSYPLYLLPSRFWRTIMPDTASDIITIFVFGSKKGMGDVYGEVPIDLISIGYIQFGIIGVVVFAVFFGFFVAKVLNAVSNISNIRTRTILVAYITIDVALRSVFYADSYNVVQRMFSLVVFGLIYWGIGLISRGKIFAKNKSSN